ncbi:ankyrin repeat and LEM domain-containing protein 1 [Melanerpes formicivorus]|uniref:ankyrin repeat and LEM domain-containing protein 1 n=1 Tax=Melanerpes formicivorus TaxID=211600 RepID=UPI00358F1CFE
MSGARRREPSSAELPPLHVAASRGCLRCLRLLLREQRRPELPEQDGKPAVDLALEQGTHGWHSHGAQDGLLTQDPGGARCSLSFLTEDGTGGSIFPTDGLLSSTRRSLLEELEGGCCLGDPPCWQGYPQPLSVPSFTPWPPTDPEGPPQPLASSTLLGPGEESPPSCRVGGRTRGPPWPLPEPCAGDSPVPSSQQGSLSSAHPQHGGRVLGGHRGTPPRAPHLRRGALSCCSVTCQHPRDEDSLGAAAQHHPGVPQGPPMGWAGLGSATLAATGLGTPVLEVGARGRDQSSSGDSSGDSEVFVSAMETLEPSKAGGCQGAQHHRSPQPWASRELQPGKTPSPRGAAPRELPPALPLDSEQAEDLGRVSRVVPHGREGSGGGETGKLLAQLQGCSIQDSSPCTPEPLSSFSLASGDVTPQGQGSPGHRHVTPRTKSRLQACAQRFSSSSSSLFDETLEMPRRPPRIRAPQGVPKGPATTSGHSVTLQGEDGEGTASLDDTKILPRAPSQPSSPPGASSSATPTVLLLPGDHQHPQTSPADAQGSHSSSPTVLLLPGDHQHPQTSPADAQGSHSSSPTVLLLPGDQGSQSEAPSSSHAAGSASLRVLDGGSGWQDPSPLGAQPSPCPRASFSHPLAPHLLGGPAVGPGSSARLLSPPSCGSSEEPPEDEEPLKDEEQGQTPAEQHRPGTEAAASPKDAPARAGQTCPVPPGGRLSDAALRRRLRALGDSPGPITELTRGLYLRRLQELARAPRGHRAARTPQAGHSPELAAALSTGQVPDCTPDELVLAQQFDRPGRGWRWREGLVKTSFNYLLLDPRTTQNLPLRSHCLSPAECFRTFIQAIFYVGKGTRARPYCHLTEALSQHRAGTQRGSPKVRRILEIWASGQGVVSLHCFQSSIPAEAYTRECCLVEALGLQSITNQRQGNSYGAAARWAAERRRRLGVHLLHRAMRIFLAEGERQLRPADIQGGC